MESLGASFLRSSYAAFAHLCVALLLAACGSAGDTEQDIQAGDVGLEKEVGTSTESGGPSSISISALTKVGEARVSRTVFDYTFRVTVQNAGSDRVGVTLTLTGVGAGAVIVDGAVVVGDLGAGASTTPSDVIIVRQDRSIAFEPAKFQWQVSAGSPPTPPGTGILLSGSATAKAMSVLTDYSATLTTQEAAKAAHGNLRYYAFQLNAVIANDATVAAVNAALTATGVRIIASLSGSRVVTLLAPEASSLSQLRSIAQQLKSSGAFTVATIAPVMEPLQLPNGISASDVAAATGGILHHAAVGLTAAWNAVNARPATGGPGVEAIIIDFFGRGALTGLVSAPTGIANVGSAISLADDLHGYHVAGIYAGNFGGGSDARGRVTGSLPVPIPIHIIDLNYLAFSPVNEPELTFIFRRLQEIVSANPTAKYVLNLSIGWKGGGLEMTPQEKDDAAYIWREGVRNLRVGGSLFSWDTNVIQVSAAGNANGIQASDASEYSRAALTHELYGQPRLAAALVVENREVNTSGKVPVPGGLYRGVDGSNVGGDVGAIGVNVYSFLSADSGGAAGLMTGTSMAAPQVAGVAAWMAYIRPSLSPVDIVERIRGIRFTDSPAADASPAIDAYAALLSLDVSFSDAPVRTAMLKASASGPVTPGQLFDINDARLFLRAYFPQAYGLPPRATDPDYSRFDLNGDGYTGGPTRRPFDLKFTGQNVQFSPENIEKYEDDGQLVTGLSENGVTDFEVLCYYVRSPLFKNADLAEFNLELQDKVTPGVGRNVTCANVAPVLLTVETTNSLYGGLPAKITISGFASTTPVFFQLLGSPGNTCGGERGGPLYSSMVPFDAQFFSVTTVLNPPYRLEAPPNRRPCSSFFARRPNPPPATGEQVWINATARGERFGGVTLDWETQVRYSNGDAGGIGRQCEVGVVPNTGVFLKNFDATCTHAIDTVFVME